MSTPEQGAASFSEKLTDILNYGAVNLAMAIGYRVGLFDVLDTFSTPQPLETISEKAGLNSRYVREWLGVMVSAGMVKLFQGEDHENRFYLPKAHGDLITRRAGNSNLGVYTQEIPLLTQCAMEAVIRRFYTGDGIPYENYPQFQKFMSELADAKHQAVLVEKFLASVDGGRLIRQLRSGIRVCDLGCAEGVAVMIMAQEFPQSRFIGIDLSAQAIEMARGEALQRHIDNVDFYILDAATLKQKKDWMESVDFVTAFDAIHDQTRPLDALKGVYHILAPNGIFSMVDIAAESHLFGNQDHPMGPFLYTVSLMHCLPVGLVDGGSGLGMMWGRQQAVEMLGIAGFREVQVLEIPGDSFNFHFFCRK